MITTTKDTLTQHMASIAFSSLPRTFQDSITTCRYLGIRFIWIDSLCIIQDSVEDWEAKSSMMGNFYKNSVLTIAAVSAADSRMGCYMARNGLAIRPCLLDMKENLGRGVESQPFLSVRIVILFPRRSSSYALPMSLIIGMGSAGAHFVTSRHQLCQGPIVLGLLLNGGLREGSRRTYWRASSRYELYEDNSGRIHGRH